MSREEKYLMAVQGALVAAGEDQLEGSDLEKCKKAIHALLPIWDMILPLIVGDIVKAVKDANANG